MVIDFFKWWQQHEVIILQFTYSYNTDSYVELLQFIIFLSEQIQKSKTVALYHILQTALIMDGNGLNIKIKDIILYFRAD